LNEWLLYAGLAAWIVWIALLIFGRKSATVRFPATDESGRLNQEHGNE